MAPELIRFETHGSPVDIWSLGCIVYELLFGELPFEGDEGTPFEIWGNVMQYVTTGTGLTFPALYYMKSRTHWNIQELIEKMLSANPADRPLALEISGHAALDAYPLLQMEQKTIPAPIPPALAARRHKVRLSRLVHSHAHVHARACALAHHMRVLSPLGALLSTQAFIDGAKDVQSSLAQSQVEDKPNKKDVKLFAGFQACEGWGEDLARVKHLTGDLEEMGEQNVEPESEAESEDDGVVAKDTAAS